MSDFKIGQFVRVKATGRAMQIAGASSPELPLAVFLKRGSLRELRTVEGIEPWTPRDGERVRITMCERHQAIVGRALSYDANLWVFGRDEGVPRAEFEPVLESEPKEADTGALRASLSERLATPLGEPFKIRLGADRKTALSLNEAASAMRAMLDGLEFPEPFTMTIGYSSPDVRRANPPAYGGTPSPLAELRQRRLESAKEVLGAKWKGRKT